MEEVKKNWYSKLPKWFQFILLIISLITVVYWLGLKGTSINNINEIMNWDTLRLKELDKEVESW